MVALPYAALGLGIGGTVAVNVAAGVAFGMVGAIVAAWPAVALVLSYELLMLVVRDSARTAPRSGYARARAASLPQRSRL